MLLGHHDLQSIAGGDDSLLERYSRIDTNTRESFIKERNMGTRRGFALHPSPFLCPFSLACTAQLVYSQLLLSIFYLL